MISIIVPALNEALYIERTLTAAAGLRGDKEIIVADGDSEDATIERAEACGARVIRAPRGRGPQLHTGVREARGDVLWFLHADALAPPEALEAIEAALVDPGVAGGSFKVRFEGMSTVATQLNTVYSWLRLLGLEYGDAGIFVRRSVYDQVGGFRPYALFEDMDLVKRVRACGRFVRIPCTLVTSSRRFEACHATATWARWIALQVFYWAGVHPDRLARWYKHTRG